jgi:hypothetical protein
MASEGFDEKTKDEEIIPLEEVKEVRICSDLVRRRGRIENRVS